MFMIVSGVTITFQAALWGGSMDGGLTNDNALVAISSTRQVYWIIPSGAGSIYLKIRTGQGCQGQVFSYCSNSPCTQNTITTGRDYYVDLSQTTSQFDKSLSAGMLIASTSGYTSFQPSSLCQPTASPSPGGSSTSWWTTGNIIWVVIVIAVAVGVSCCVLSTVAGVLKTRKRRGLPICCCPLPTTSSYSYTPATPAQPSYVPPTNNTYTPYTPPTEPQPFIPATVQPIEFGGDSVMLDPVTGAFIVQEQPPQYNEKMAPQFDPITGEFRM
jgi:hypothetical protein